MRHRLIAPLLALIFLSCATTQPAPAANHTAAINHLLDQWHSAASRADERSYFEMLSPGAVFFGTDATERWTREEFRAYAHPHFSKGKGWTFVPRNRNVYLSRDGKSAWFDEVLDSASYGLCRGTGGAQLYAEGWKIEQYNLSIPIPNDLADTFVKMIREKK